MPLRLKVYQKKEKPLQQELVAKWCRVITQTLDKRTTENIAACEDEEKNWLSWTTSRKSGSSTTTQTKRRSSSFWCNLNRSDVNEALTSPSWPLNLRDMWQPVVYFSNLFFIERMITCKALPEWGSVLTTVYLKIREQSKHIITSCHGAEPLIKKNFRDGSKRLTWHEALIVWIFCL